MHEDNIYIHQKNIKLVDFGLSKEEESKTTAQLFGMIPYIDPKSFNVNDTENYELDEKSDVYSIGMLLWRISSGCRPFHGEPYNVILATAILEGRRENIVDGPPKEYNNLYTECWNYQPDERPDIKRVVSTLLRLKTSNEEETNATKWIKELLKNKTVNSISFNEFKDPKPLDKGGFGQVVRVKWTRTNNFIVYKRLTNTDAVKYDALEAFIHELRINLLLDCSERIIRCLGISQDNVTNDYLLVMQYADSGNLRTYLQKNRKLTWHNKRNLALQIAEGLSYLHNENVLHRDLHSKNIVIHENKAKIIDFGISKLQDQSSKIHTRGRGIIAYMEPNRISNLNFPYTKASDIYSFGVLMWEISSGYPPFKNNSYSELDRTALSFNISRGARETPIPNTPIKYKDLYIKCWDQEPDKRVTIKEILEELTEIDFRINGENEITEDTESSNKSKSDLQGDLVIKT